jgi:hypothetical protein
MNYSKYCGCTRIASHCSKNMQQKILWQQAHCLTLQQKHCKNMQQMMQQKQTCLHTHCLTLQQKHAAENAVAASALPHIAAKTCSKNMQRKILWLQAHCLTLQQKHATNACSKRNCGCTRIASHCSKNMQQRRAAKNTVSACALLHIAAKTCSKILRLHAHCLTLQLKHAAKTCNGKYCGCKRIASHCSKNMQQTHAAKKSVAAHALPHIAAKTCSGKYCGCKRIASHCSKQCYGCTRIASHCLPRERGPNQADQEGAQQDAQTIL